MHVPFMEGRTIHETCMFHVQNFQQGACLFLSIYMVIIMPKYAPKYPIVVVFKYDYAQFNMVIVMHPNMVIIMTKYRGTLK